MMIFNREPLAEWVCHVSIAKLGFASQASFFPNSKIMDKDLIAWLWLQQLILNLQAEALVKRLRNSEYYALAIFVAKQYDLEQAWIWKAWTEALLK